MPKSKKMRIKTQEERFKHLSRLRQRNLRETIAAYGPQERYTKALEEEMKRHGALAGHKKRRRSRSLSGSLEHHRKNTFDLMDDVAYYADATVERAKGRECKRALRSLGMGHEYEGRMLANAAEISMKPDFDVRERLRAAERFFETACLVRRK